MANWIIQEVDNMPHRDSNGVPFAIQRILARRGITEAQLEDFLAPMPKETYDPFLFYGVREAGERILAALDKGTDIVIYGDYDADGVTSTALLLNVLKNFSHKVDFYIPSRFVDGYGLNNNAIAKIAEKHPKCLMITVDCGSTSHDEIEFAKSLGLDVIVSDHHNFEESCTPDCLILNPKYEKNEYPFKYLSGCGVAFKLAQGLERICKEKGDTRFTKSQLNSLLDLVAISTIADVVPLVGENRSLVKYGLRIVNERRRRGLAALLDILGVEGEVIGDTIAYTLAPNINALGRIGSASLGVELLEGSSKSMSELYSLAENMVENNKKRRAEQEKTAKICIDQMNSAAVGNEHTIVILAPGAHEGVAGIVAGNLKEQYYRPVFICTPNGDGTLKGTGRCVPGINLHELMAKHSDLFIRYGGHAGACGFSMEEGKFNELCIEMDKEVKILLDQNPDILTENLLIEKELNSTEKNVNFAKQLSRLEPFGEANPVPVFCVCNARVDNIFYLGNEKQHVRFSAKTADGSIVSCIYFRKAQYFNDIADERGRLDIAGTLSLNEFNGRQRLQMIVKDIRRSKN